MTAAPCSMQEFWSKQHEADERFWLTGTPPALVFTMHGIEVPENMTVLDIGVGTGDFTNWCAARGNQMIACDISETALNKVKATAETYLVEDLSKAPPADMAICHLVFQHCSDEMVLHILKSVQLKPSGIFSFQFACLLNPVVTPLLQTYIDEGKLVFRGQDAIYKLIEQAGPRQLLMSGVSAYNWKGNSIGWHFVKCGARHG